MLINASIYPAPCFLAIDVVIFRSKSICMLGNIALLSHLYMCNKDLSISCRTER